ncbi:MAG: hypothetical protein WEB30_08565 [Cyclobacteriaceae bacterium]
MKKKLLDPFPRVLFNALYSMLVLVSCEDDHKQKLAPSVIQFSVNIQNVSEGNEASILLTLDKPAPGNASVELTLETNAVYDQHFGTDPSVSNNTIELQIAKGQKSAEFKITTIDNDKYEGTRFIIFQLKSKSEGLRVGDITALTLTIGDDEGPSMAYFAASSAILNETSENGILVEIPFSAAAKGEGSLTVSLYAGMAIPGTNFTIDQELTNNSFSFNVVKNTTGVSFKVFPINNDLFTGDFTLAFTISEISGVVQKGNNLKYTLKLADDETRSLARFAAPSGTADETSEEGIVVDILLSSPAKGEGTMAISFSSRNLFYGIDFTTLPEANGNRITLDFSHNQSSGSFKVFPRNDDLLNGNRTLLFLIIQSTGIVGRGDDTVTHELTFIDDEKPSVATFALTSAVIDETSSDGTEVEIVFSDPALAPGRIIVDAAGYTGNFTSDPALVEVWHDDSYPGYYTYQIALDVPVHATGASFKIMPINDSHCNASDVTTFTITDVSGSIRKEEPPAFDLTINDDENQMRVTLAELNGTLDENDIAGKEIVLNFSKPSVVDGFITVSLDYYYNYYDYNGRYTTLPAMNFSSGYDSYLELHFRKDDRSVKFKVVPINDHVAQGDVTETFYISISADVCARIQDNTYKLTIADDDD